MANYLRFDVRAITITPQARTDALVAPDGSLSACLTAAPINPTEGKQAVNYCAAMAIFKI